ncbi:MAG: hypothetical protein ACEQSE_11430 [Candidatus Aquirickettsiella gammari]
MATPNYGYEKRQKELAKKRKKEEKLKNRAERGGAETDATDIEDAAEIVENIDQKNDPA